MECCVKNCRLKISELGNVQIEWHEVHCNKKRAYSAMKILCLCISSIFHLQNIGAPLLDGEFSVILVLGLELFPVDVVCTV